MQFKVDAPASAPAVCAEEQAVVVTEEQAGETTLPQPLPTADASGGEPESEHQEDFEHWKPGAGRVLPQKTSGVEGAAEAKASQPLPLPLPSDDASAEGAAQAEPRGEAPASTQPQSSFSFEQDTFIFAPPLTVEPPPAYGSEHAEAWLAELPHMNLF